MDGKLVKSIWNSEYARGAVFGVAYFAFAELGQALSYDIRDQTFASFWPPAGLFLATLVLTTRVASWPIYVFAACVANLTSDVVLHDKSIAVSLGFCAANSAEACVGAWLLNRFGSTPFTLTGMRDVLRLALASVFLSTALGATMGAAIVTWGLDAPSYWIAWRTWWMADALGILIVAPVIFTWTAQSTAMFNANHPWRIAESAALFLGLFVVAEGVYGDHIPPPFNVPAFILPFLLWSAVRFDAPNTAAAILVTALVGVWNISTGHGPYSVMTSESSEQMLRAQGTLGVLSLSVWLLSATVAERRIAEQARLLLIAELQQALGEIKTLRGLIPICAWCKKFRDDQDAWHSIENYIAKHTEARLSHGICPDCYAKAIDE